MCDSSDNDYDDNQAYEDDEDDHFGHDPFCESCSIYGDCVDERDCIHGGRPEE